MATISQTLPGEISMGAVQTHSWRTGRLANLFWLALAIFVLPSLAVFLLFGRPPEFLSGWLNIEFCALTALALQPRLRFLALTALAFELLADLVEPFAHIYYFTGADAVQALKYMQVIPRLRLAGYGVMVSVTSAHVYFV